LKDVSFNNYLRRLDEATDDDEKQSNKNKKNYFVDDCTHDTQNVTHSATLPRKIDYIPEIKTYK